MFIHDTDNMPILDIKNCGKIIDNNSINVQNGMQANLGSINIASLAILMIQVNFEAII